MTQTEWIISLDDDLKDYEELFVGNVRDGERLIRCKDCIHWEKNNWNPNGMCNAFDDGSVCILTETDADEYCARAERKEE